MPSHTQGQEAEVDMFDAPVPGESLTADPASPQAYEKAPQFTTEEEAIEEIFMVLTEEDKYEEVLDMMRSEIPIEDIAQIALFDGFRKGLWNPDMMLLLIEPTIYLLAFFANLAEIDAVLYPEGDEDDGDDESNAQILSILEGKTSIDETVTLGGETLQRPQAVSENLLDTLREKA